jgi:hypothetical protein
MDGNQIFIWFPSMRHVAPGKLLLNLHHCADLLVGEREVVG